MEVNDCGLTAQEAARLFDNLKLLRERVFFFVVAHFLDYPLFNAL